VASQVINLKAAGLQTYYQSLMEISPGALLKANNTVINREGVIEPRRGIKTYSPSDIVFDNSVKINQLLEYKGRVLRHLNNQLQFDNGSGVFTSFSTLAINEPSVGYRIKSVDAKNNLFFTTNAGVKKISASSAENINTDSISNVGVSRASIRQIKTLYGGNGNSLFGFFPEYVPTSTVYVAYRVTWSYTDKNQNLLIGAPSPRVIASNVARESYARTYIEIDIPTEIKNAPNATEYKYSIYRSEINIEEPTDELRLVYEANLTSGWIAANVVTYEDKTLEINRKGGVVLYSNPETGEGTTKTNEQPPSAQDLALFNGHLFYANTRERHSIQLKLDRLDYSNFNNGNIIITNGTVTNKYTFEGAALKYDLTFPAGNLINNYEFIKLYSSNNERVYMIVFNRTDITNDPILPNAGEIVILVNISNTSTNINVANAVKSAIESNVSSSKDFTITIPPSTLNKLVIENKNNGITTTPFRTPNLVPLIPLNIITTGLGEDILNKKVVLSNNTNPEEALKETMTSLVRVINANPNEIVRATYASNLYEVQGKIFLESLVMDDIPFFVTSTDTGIPTFTNSSYIRESFTPNLSSYYTNTAITYNSSTNLTTVTIPALIQPDINARDKVAIINSTTQVNGTYTVNSIDYTGSTFTYTVKGLIFLTGFNIGITINQKTISTATALKNRIYYSKFFQPEAVPFLNFLDIGSSEFEISRIIALRESLFVLKKDGIFRITGEGGPDPVWGRSVVDNTSVIRAPDTAVTLSNQCYFFSNQGVIRLNESSNEVISKPIHDKLIPFLTTNQTIHTASFSVPYETDRAFLLWTVSNKTDSKSTICYRFNVDTATWTEWKIAANCGILNEHQDKLYIGGEYVSEDGKIEYSVDVERKNFNRFDYADREFIFQLDKSKLNGLEIGPFSIYNFSIGDVISQEQYLTIFQFNTLLKKLDMDDGLNFTNFFNNYNASYGDDLSLKMAEVVQMLDSLDSSTDYVSLWSNSSIFSVMQTDFNSVIQALNNSSVTYFSNYLTSEGTTVYEAIVTDKKISYNTITIKMEQPFITGDMKLYKAILSEIQYAPQHAGDASSFKQFSGGEFLFERRSFSSAIAAYNSDISDNYEEIVLNSKSAGIYGDYSWGEGTVWGGQGDQSQIRTYIPLKKQRCRFLGCKFIHSTALESYQLYGISLSVRAYSIPDRDYR